MTKKLIKNFEEFQEWYDYNREDCYMSCNSTQLPDSYPCILIHHEYGELGSWRPHIIYDFIYLDDFKFKD